MIQKESVLGPSRVFLFSIFAASFLILYFILSYYNRLSADDFYYLKHAQDLGIWNGMVFSYTTWVTRWMSILFLNCVLISSVFFHSLLPFHLVTLVALIFVSNKFLNLLAGKFMAIKMSPGIRLLYTVLLAGSFFFFTFNIGESWFWVTSAVMYVWSVIFFIGGLTCIFQPEKNWTTKAMCILCFLYIGASAEAVALNVLILLLAGIAGIFYQAAFSLRNSLRDGRFLVLLIATASLLTALLISYAGEGRIVRQSALPDTGLIKSLFISVKSFLKLIFFYLPLKIHWFFFFFLPWVYLGQKLSSVNKESLEKVFLKMGRFLLIFLLLSFISFIPTSFLLGETGPFRTWILISFYLAICCGFCGFYLGYKASLNEKLVSRLLVGSLVTLVVLMTINILDQNKITSEYASATDERMKDLIRLKNTGEKNTVRLKMLPPSGMLYSSEISDDSSDFSNQHLKSFLELKFDIRK